MHDSRVIPVVDALVRHLEKLEFLFVFMPLLLLAVDCALYKLCGITILPYAIFDTKGYLLVSLVVIFILALIMAEIKPSVLGKDVFVAVNIGIGNLSLPKNTTGKIIESYFIKRKLGKSIRGVLVFVGLELFVMFLYGTLVGLLIYKNYLQSIMFG